MPNPPADAPRHRRSRKVPICRACQASRAAQLEAVERAAERLAIDLQDQLRLLMAGPEGQPDRHSFEDVFGAILRASLEASSLHHQIRELHSRVDGLGMHPFDFSNLVRETLRLMDGKLPEGLQLKAWVTSGIWITGQADLLQRAILNLLRNGLQAMEGHPGRLCVRLEETVLPPGEALVLGLAPGRHVQLSVMDEGGGIPDTLLPQIFVPGFTTQPGTRKGLGLSQARTIATDHQGSLAIVPQEGPGTCFRLLLPCTTPARPSQPDLGSARLQGSERILYVDADPLLQDLTRLGLEALGYHVVAVGDGAQALDDFRQHPSFYDAVVFDLVLPHLGGIDLAHRIHHVRRDLPLILLTDLPVNSRTLRAAHTHLREVLLKPCTPTELAGCLRRHLPPRQPGPASGPAGRHGRSGHPSILLAEDSAVTRGMIRTWLQQGAFSVQEAKDGEAAWEVFQKAAAPFDLLITDVVMPRVDGLELARRVRAVDPSLPIVVMTTVEDRETMKTALLVGVNDFLNKPFEKEVLLTCVQQLLADTGRRAVARRTEETAQAVRMAQRALLAEPEKDLPLFTLHEPLTDAGGDVFRATRLEDGRILFVLGDVAGHSVISSYAVAAFLGMLSTFQAQALDLPTLARRLNQGIQDGPFSEVPVCTLLGLWHPDTGRVHLLNAGIPHGVLCRASTGMTRTLPLNGTPLGILPEPPMDETIINLHPGDRLLFGTDGFFEVLSPDRHPFEEQVVQQWALLKDTPVQWALSLICEAARAHGEGLLSDDLLVLGFEQGPLVAPPEEFLRDLASHALEIDLVIQEFKVFLEGSERGRAYPPDRRFEIVLALREALTNAVFHGNQNQPGARITLHAAFEGPEGLLRVRVADEGSGFPLDQHLLPTEIDSERGRGLPLIRHFAQAVAMAGSELCLTFTPEGPGHADSPTIPDR